MFVRTALIGLSLTLPALPVAAQQMTAQDCTVFGQITQQAVLARNEGKREKSATRQIARGYSGDLERFKGAVPLLVEFVYDLPADKLGPNVGKTYADACKAQAS